jgi:hypothetical protein
VKNPENPAYLKAFKAYQAQEPTSAEVPDMEQEFYGGSDRAVVILQAVAVEIMLEEAIKSLMTQRSSLNLSKDVFGFDRPIGTFSAKSLIAYALGIFGKKTHDLRLIRELRNGCAHTRRHLGFSVPPMAEVCANLYIPDIKRIAKYPQPMLTSVNGKRSAPDMSDPRSRYLTACYTISCGLVVFAQQPKVVPFRLSALP